MRFNRVPRVVPGQTGKYRFNRWAWMDVVVWPVAVVALTPLVWNLGRIVVQYLGWLD